MDKRKYVDYDEDSEEDFIEEFPDPDEMLDEDMEEKMEDVNGIIKKEEDEAEEESRETENNHQIRENKEKTEVKENKKIRKEPGEEREESRKEDSWKDSFDESANSTPENNPGKVWKIISAVLLLLLFIAIYTHGFTFTGSAVAELNLAEAEIKVIDYVNSNLLQQPFTATVRSSADKGNLYQITLDIFGQEVESYVTKDGKMFFPQGFALDEPFMQVDTSDEAGFVPVSTGDNAVKGDENAPVTIIEFSEYECPFCKRYVDETYPLILRDYVDTGKAKYVFRDFPLSFHPNAFPAALASECAHEQGKFWEYHDLLFANQDSLGIDNYKEWAKELGLNTAQFDACLDSEKYADEVEADMADGQRYGVTGTPAFFINGKLISGAQPYDVFVQAIEAELAAMANASAAPATGSETETAESSEVEVEMAAKKWRFDPNTVQVSKGDQVKLIVTSEIDIYFLLEEFGVEEEISAGEIRTIEFNADQTGTFEFGCGNYCITNYGELQGSSLKGSLVVN